MTGGELGQFLLLAVYAGVAAASLTHDIGNPPFGHAGEEAISDFFRLHPSSPIANDLSIIPCYFFFFSDTLPILPIQFLNGF